MIEKIITKGGMSIAYGSSGMTEQERVMELMADVLQESQNGLEWYRQEHPNDLSDVDFEIDRRINKALAEYRKLKGE